MTKFHKFLKAGLKTKILYLWDVILRHPNLDNGFIEVKPVKEDYVHTPDQLGAVKKEMLIIDGNWKPYRPKG